MCQFFEQRTVVFCNEIYNLASYMLKEEPIFAGFQDNLKIDFTKG